MREDDTAGSHPLVRARKLVALLHDAALERTLEAGDFVHLEGDVAETVSLVVGGQLLLEAYPFGSWVPSAIGVAGPGHLVGSEGLQPLGSPRASTVRALTACTLVVVHRDEMLAATAASAAARQLVLALLADSVAAGQRGMLAGSATAVDVRVGRWVLHMHETFTGPDGACPDIAATQEHLASLAGTRRPTANKVLKSLEADELVGLGRARVRVLDVRGLQRWLEAHAEE